MLKSRIGYSVDTDSFSSGKETALRAMEKFKAPKLGIIACSSAYEKEEVIKGVQSVTRDLPLIGCTSAGAVIIPEGVISSEKGFSSMMLFDDEDMRVSVAGSEKENDSRETGRRVAIEAIKKSGTKQRPSYFYIVTSDKEEELYLKGIEDVIGRVPCFGGSYVNDIADSQGGIICDNQILVNGCAVAFFYSNKKIDSEYTGAYRETEDIGIITKIENNQTLVEIDHTTSLKKYAEWMSTSPDVLQGDKLSSLSVTSPLGVKDPMGDITIIRHPMIGNNDNTMEIGSKLEVGTAVIRMEATVDELISSTKETIIKARNELKSKAGAYLLLHDNSRKIVIDNRLEEVYKNIKTVAGNTPFMMIFTASEYGSANHSANMCGRLMLSFTSFAE